MERQFFINWQAIVEEAKARRKKLKLTQQQLAKFAKVSTPTVSHFENGEENIQLSSIKSILGALGMVDERRLDFNLEKQPPAFDFAREVVWFKGNDGDKKITCAISREALNDNYQGDDKDPVKVFIANHEQIEQVARRKYLNSLFNEEGMILIKSEDK